MQVTETLNEGLKREIKVVVPAKDLNEKAEARLEEMKTRVKINGFRPGKVPLAHVRKLYGTSVMAEIVQSTIEEQVKVILADRNEKAAQQPSVKMTEDEKEAETVLAGKADFEFSISYEVIPDFKVTDLSKLKIEREVAEVTDKMVDEEIEKLGANATPFETKKGKAAKGDRVTMDYLGKIDGEPFDGGKDEGANLVLGSNQFIPGFEDGLKGVAAGDEKTIKVTFPAEYGAAHLAGKDAEFDVKIHEIAKPGKLELNDEFAKTLGVESFDKLKELVRGQVESQYGSMTRQKVKRELLDALDKAHKFELPEQMVEAEFNNIWGQVTGDLERSGKTFKDEGTTEAKAKKEYQTLAERRVRLGLVLSQIGTDEKVEVSEQELQQALYAQVQQYPGQEKEVFEFFKSNPEAVAGLRAPLFEDKVVDVILEKAAVKDKKVSIEELMKDGEEEHVHDENCDHDHD